MQVLEVYKKLPKTNCGVCGESSCMAFALKVYTGQRALSDCTPLRIVYDYVLRKGNAPLAGAQVPFDQFPRTPSHVKTFLRRAESELARAFATDPDALRARLCDLGGVEIQGKAKTDLTFQLTPLPHLPLYLHFQAADEDFPASCKLFVDRNATRNLDVEYISRLVAKCVERIAGTDSA